ncbi:TonB-dependent receptor domain-containing protein [Novosphingobium piscinae]|uniref:TonB-dependent receptor domain-containing protein n=1 Tax=Novosphingobium piscinae TaxID=1507448 RepID=UPI001C8BBBC5|nr:TonB-dependent receptor [Novosphingobium piscinae]
MAQAAAAQEAAPPAPPGPAAPAEDESEIVVTGTIIRGAAPVGSSIISVTATDIEKTGLLTTNDILRSIPQVSGIGLGEAATNTSANNANLNISRANALNIRGLGIQATLTLLNGRRLPVGGFGGQLFDPNSIPAIALARIDVVADGASATYGSDAVAGVANLVLRTDVDRLEVRARYGAADDFSNTTLSGVFGRKWSTGRAMIAAEYGWNDQLLQSDRAPFFLCDQTGVGGINNCVFGGAPGNIVYGTTRFGLPAGSGVGVTQAQLSTTPNRLQTSLFQTVIPQNKRLNIVASLRQDVSEQLTAWAEGFLYQRKGQFYTGSPAVNAVSVPNTNPGFVTVAGQSATAQTVEYSVYNDWNDGRLAFTTERGVQAAGGLDLKLGENWTASASITYNNNYAQVFRTGEINTQQYALAVRCTVAGFCLNPYGSGGTTANRSALDRIMGFTNFRIWYDATIANAQIGGTLASIGGGDIKLAVGGQYMKETLYAFNTTNAGARPVDLQQIIPTAEFGQSRKIKSAFAEVIVPLVGAGNAMRGVQALEANLAVRHDDYSDFGQTTNPKFGLKWEPIDGLALRGSYGTSFRAPTLSDNDPRSTPSLGASNTAAGAGRNVLTLLGGNADVGPETASTWSFGIELKPSLIRGFTASFNYFGIDYKNVIDTLGNSASVFSDPALASFVTLSTDPTFAARLADIQSKINVGFYQPPTQFALYTNGGTTPNVYAIVDGRKRNVGRIKMNGLDFSLAYQFPTGDLDWTLGVTGTRVFSYKLQAVPGAALVDRVNNVNFPLKFRARGQIGFQAGGWSVNSFYNYTNAYRVVSLLGNNLFNPAIVAPATQNERVAANMTVDATITYTFAQDSGPLRDLSLSLAAQNVFDKDPPFARVSQNQIFDSANASVLGRMVSLELRKKF